MKIIAIIPARYGSKRLLGKPLIQINNKPLIQLTYEAVLNSKLFDFIFIATDSKKIKNIGEKFGAKCIITSKKNNNGTERCAELIQKLHSTTNEEDIIINIQCDEPFIQQTHLNKIINSCKKNIEISTIISPINNSELTDQSIVKVIMDNNKIAINFSRDTSKLQTNQKTYKHIGIYGYNKKTLLKIVELNATKREVNEKLEQLRWLEHNYPITCVFIDDNLTSINTNDDLKKLSKKHI